jgi:hypothetical protein
MPFARAEIVFVGLFTEHIDAILHWPVNAKVDNTSRGLRIEAAAQWLQETIKPDCSTHALGEHKMHA